jgi:hypothetical protein
MTDFTPTAFIVRVWRVQAKVAPVATSQRFDDLQEATAFYRGRFVNVARVDLEAWAFNPKRHKVLASRGPA